MSISATSAPTRTSSLELRPIRFEEVAVTLGLIQRASDRGCRERCDPAQRSPERLRAAGVLVPVVRMEKLFRS